LLAIIVYSRLGDDSLYLFCKCQSYLFGLAGPDYWSSENVPQRNLTVRIRDILQKKGAEVQTIEAGGNLHEAIARLNEHSIGALIVTGEDEEIIGIITERDILRVCGERCNHLIESPTRKETTCPSLVQDVMTKDLVIGVLDDDLDYVIGIMTRNRVRHLPILDDGSLVGIISIGDVINAHLKEQVFENRMLRNYIQGPG
jgi:CBS domain-containing protein